MPRKTDPPVIDYSATPAAVAHMRGSAGKVWAALYEHGAISRPVFASHDLIARWASVSRPTVKRSLDALIDAAFAEVLTKGRPSSYRVYTSTQRSGEYARLGGAL